MECVSFKLFSKEASIASTSLARVLVHVLIGVVANLRPTVALVSKTILGLKDDSYIPCRDINCLIIIMKL